jgi:hypothetical protein
MKWYHYVTCFVAGVFLIHILPHVLNGLSVKNVVGVLVSLGVGSFLLWIGRFSFRNVWAIAAVVAGMSSVFVFLALHPHHLHHVV